MTEQKAADSQVNITTGEATIGGDVTGRDKITNHLQLHNYFVNAVPVKCDDAVTKLSQKISGPQARQIARQRLRAMPWTKQAAKQRLCLHLATWPIAIYYSRCQAIYQVRKAKSLGRVASILEPDDWEVVELTSKILSAQIVMPACTATQIELRDLDLMRRALAAINGWASESETLLNEAPVIKSTLRLPTLSASWVYRQLKLVAHELTKPFDAPPLIVWPNLTVARKRLGLLRTDYSTYTNLQVNALPENLEAQLIGRGRAIIQQELSQAVQQSPGEGRLSSNPSYRDEAITAIQYPFWVIEASTKSSFSVMVIDGVSGKVSYRIDVLGTSR